MNQTFHILVKEKGSELVKYDNSNLDKVREYDNSNLEKVRE